MKFHWWCAAALLAIASAAVDVERTVQQVQSILKANSQLPRLSRDEILQLLNDIRAEDAKSKSSSREHSIEIDSSRTKIPYNNIDHVNQSVDINDNIVSDDDHLILQTPTSTIETTTYVETTTKSEPSVMVVLPYTPRDGFSLQELYTRPPRVEVVPESKVTPKPISQKANERFQNTLKKNAQIASANKQTFDISAELQAFLDSHGLKGKPGQDNFLLPLDGFKPLPPAKVIDGTVQLPENILLSYDLVADSAEKKTTNKEPIPPTGFLYEPLRPELPFELDTSSSETKKSILPLDLPKRNVKPEASKQPNYAPIDYDSVKVIPLGNGPNPVDDDKVDLSNDQGKRQANSTNDATDVSSSTQDTTTTTTTTSSSAPIEDDAKTNAPPPTLNDNTSADSDTGASLADLEESFGGAVPGQPGDSELPPPRKNGFYWMLDWNSFLEVGDGDTKVNIRFEPKLGDPQMFLPVNVP